MPLVITLTKYNKKSTVVYKSSRALSSEQWAFSDRYTTYVTKESVRADFISRGVKVIYRKVRAGPGHRRIHATQVTTG